ncbi:PREDICTED: scavenger receptor cysteine-rich type 1 protein M130-like [Nanorana parkeri]|uniref:scavenger receptor cysteine-rich type 1 protein M130-like n=1 Tax=Nanorana parkeri TaxID=125878 RepID=UPI000854E97F|nr:PREDICTED: scavenger receptor cysteine-rich type 1 protein M130-like [Nanorana parkeri]
MELALPLSWYLLCVSRFAGLSGAAELYSTLVTFQNESMVESGDTCQGIVIIFSNETGSLVCDDQWSVESPLAHVVCKESGCGTPNTTLVLKSLPQGSLEAVQGVHCTGNESGVSECESSGKSVQLCAAESIAAISCIRNSTEPRDNSSWRLSRGRSSCDGHMEVFAEGRWSPVCFTSIKGMDASFFCEQMGCTPQRPLFSLLNKGMSPISPVILQCPENMTSLWECGHQVVDMCASGLTTYLQCNRPRMEESWLVWLTICLAAVMILVFCWVRVVKSTKCCVQCVHKYITILFCKKPQTRRGFHSRRNIYQREPINVTVQEAHSPPSSPGILQDPNEVNALLAPHGFRLNNTITPPPSYMHALKVLSRPLENTQTPPPSYLEALKVLSRPILVHVNADDDNEDKEDLSVITHKEKEEKS